VEDQPDHVPIKSSEEYDAVLKEQAVKNSNIKIPIEAIAAFFIIKPF
jgi:hypothetical protein